MSATKPTSKDHLQQEQVPSDDDPTSSSGSSSSESDEDDTSDNEHEDLHPEKQTAGTASNSSIPNVTGRQKPQIHRMEGGSDLLGRLSAFLPKMKDANESLEKDIAAGRGKDLVLDDVQEGDGKDYIEMNLGLGVLEEKRGDNDDSSSSDEDEEDSGKKSKTKGDSDVLGKLMGDRDSAVEKPSIEEMGE